VREPKVFLFDEPLSNLDAELRVQMRAELIELHRRLGTTMIYVTHDQVEAMTLADKMVVMNGGVIQQAGRRSPLRRSRQPFRRRLRRLAQDELHRCSGRRGGRGACDPCRCRRQRS
jgi:ABC-type Fe3+/spermidine/putrescine transport system ATPase subunit